MGTQSDLALARDFRQAGKITFPLLWDDGYDSWTGLGFLAQPSAVLVSADGRELGRWSGRADTHFDEILRLAGAS